MEKGVFSYQDEDFLEIKTYMDEIKTIVFDTYTEAKRVKTDLVDNYDGWQGNQKQQLSSFLELTLEYHKQIADNEHDPTTKFCDALTEIMDSVESYPVESTSYKSLNGAK